MCEESFLIDLGLSETIREIRLKKIAAQKLFFRKKHLLSCFFGFQVYIIYSVL